MEKHGIVNRSKMSWLKFNIALPIVFAVVLLNFLLFYSQADSQSSNITLAELISVCVFSFSGVFGFIAYKKGTLSTEKLIFLMFLCGFSLRLAYALTYGYSYHQHDVEGLSSDGHLSYIFSITSGNGLPDTNNWQFSHPPLHHALAAAVYKLSELIGATAAQAFENIQLLTVFYSSMTMLGGYRLLELCNVKGTPLLICCALLSFHPIFQILAGSINNDILMIMLVVYGTVYLLEWYKKPSVKYALLCGLFLGLAMCTKVSAAIFAVVAAVSVLFKFFTAKELKFTTVLLHAAVFCAVLLPLGLWHPIRNYILFQQPLGYVAPIPETSSLFTGDKSIFERIILPFSLDRFGIYTDVWNEYNVWYYLLRNSLFGEYGFGNEGIATAVVFCNLILILLALSATVYCFVKRLFKVSQGIIPIAFMCVIQLAFFVYFNISYPFGCSMDFRYIVPLLFGGIVFSGVAIGAADSSESVVLNKLSFCFKAVAVVFSVCSVLVML